MVHGPRDFIPDAEVELVEKRKSIPLDENEGSEMHASVDVHADYTQLARHPHATHRLRTLFCTLLVQIPENRRDTCGTCNSPDPLRVTRNLCP